MYVNLLPQAFQRKLLLRRRLMQWCLVWAICVLGAAAACGVRHRAVLAAHARLTEIETRCAPVRLVMAEAQQVEDRLAALEVRQAELKDFQPDHRALAVLAVISAAARDTQAQLHLQQLQFHSPEKFSAAVVVNAAASAPPTAATPATLNIDRGQVTLQGMAADDAAIAAFIEALRRVPVIRHAELKSSSHSTVAGEDQRQFEVLCRF